MNAVFGGARLRAGAAAAPARAPAAGRRMLVVVAVQDLKGTVMSTAMDKSIVVAVERLSPHNVYQKRVRITKRYNAHDVEGSAKVGDYVRLEGCRPLSKTKRFKLAEVIRPAQQ